MKTTLKIRDYRNSKGYTQDYMAAQLGITQNAYNKIENGKVRLKADTLMQIATILDQNVDELIIEEKEKRGCQFEQHNSPNAVGNIGKKVVHHQNDFDGERTVWQTLEKSLREIIDAKDAIIAELREKVAYLQQK